MQKKIRGHSIHKVSLYMSIYSWSYKKNKENWNYNSHIPYYNCLTLRHTFSATCWTLNFISFHDFFSLFNYHHHHLCVNLCMILQTLYSSELPCSILKDHRMSERLGGCKFWPAKNIFKLRKEQKKKADSVNPKYLYFRNTPDNL